MMKTFSAFVAFTCFALGLFATSPAHAVAPVYNWTGFYVGANFGGVHAEFKGNGNTIEAHDTGGHVIGGAQLGYSRQLDSMPVVLGVEADISGTPLDASSSTATFEEQWIATFRGRVGYAFGNFVPFVTGGLALTGTEWTITGVGSKSEVGTSHTYGGGVDFHCPMFGNSWTTRAEYLHVDVPRIISNVNGTLATGGSGNDVFRVAFNYHF